MPPVTACKAHFWSDQVVLAIRDSVLMPGDRGYEGNKGTVDGRQHGYQAVLAAGWAVEPKVSTVA